VQYLQIQTHLFILAEFGKKFRFGIVILKQRMPPMVLERSERELVEACRRGDREGFRDLFETYKNRVYSVALRFSGDEAAAMDIAQDTFVKLFSSIREFRGDASFETWVYRMVVNSCLDRKRRDRRWLPMTEEFLVTLRAQGDALSELLRREISLRVRAAVDKLAPDLKMVVVLRYTEGLAYGQIADAMGCSLGTVASRLSRAHKALEKRLARMGKENGHV
jgi:RNA polymerase sigma-70 factor (ECF subfamily)